MTELITLKIKYFGTVLWISESDYNLEDIINYG